MVIVAGAAAGCDGIANETGVGVAGAAGRGGCWESGNIDRGVSVFEMLKRMRVGNNEQYNWMDVLVGSLPRFWYEKAEECILNDTLHVK